MKVEDKEQNREEYLKDVDIFVTNRCNSNCIMCPLSETVRRKSDNGRIEEIFQQIKELPENVEYVNVTGGEPTLVGQAFFEIMDKLKMKFQNSGFQLLTNGRSAADFDFLIQLLPHLPYGIRWAIPLHASNAMLHDQITRTKGSFEQTRDVFTGQPMEGKYDIDHFIPWSFVMNDELWNLMPMDASLNSSKSNRLPKWNPFFQNFAQNQYLMYQMIYDDMRIYLGRTRIISKR